MQYPLPIILTVLGTILFSASGLPRRGLAAEAAGRESRPAAEFHAYVVSHTHSDFAWLDSIAACLDKNVAAVAKSVEIAERYPDFRFCMEHMLAVREYLRRHPEKIETVRKLMREGRFEAGGFFTGPWELTCGAEGLVRQLYLGKLWVKKNLGADSRVVWNVDVAGHTAQIPQILHKAGIRGLVISAGSSGPALFNWKARDGSAVLVWNTPWGYGAGETLGLRNKTLETMIATMPRFVDDVRRNAAEFGLPQVGFIADGFDCLAPSEQVVENIRRWNADHRRPPIRYSSTAELFAAVEKEVLPVGTGEMPSPWDSVQSQGNACFMLDRQLDGQLSAAEKFAAFASLASPAFLYPQEQFETIWENRLYAMDHNWGGWHGEENDRLKAEKIRDAMGVTEKILDLALVALAGQIAFKPPTPGVAALVVFNPLSWDRKDVVTCKVPDSTGKTGHMTLRDGQGRPVPYQLALDASGSTTGRMVFVADVPFDRLRRLLCHVGRAACRRGSGFFHRCRESPLRERVLSPALQSGLRRDQEHRRQAHGPGTDSPGQQVLV